MEIFLNAMLDMFEDPKYEGYDIVNKNKDKKYSFKFDNIRTIEELLIYLETELDLKIKNLKNEKILLIQKGV